MIEVAIAAFRRVLVSENVLTEDEPESEVQAESPVAVGN
jgi:hypothetical protein